LPVEFLSLLRERSTEGLAKAYEKVIEIAEAVRGVGGRALLVGGSVRDYFLGKISKDFDVEVYGLAPEALEELVKKMGVVKEAGKQFAVLKIPVDTAGEHLEVDVSLPRRDSKIGEGHRGFTVTADPYMSFEDAARRRDFTFNSMMADPLTGEIIDPFHGLKDLSEKKLRVTDPTLFGDDPLRVLRALQFIARFDLTVDPESVHILQENAPKVRELPRERINEEWEKMLLKGEKPSCGLDVGMRLGIFQAIHPELLPLLAVTQKENPDVDVWTHTMAVVDAAAAIAKRDKLPDEYKRTLLFAALVHDLGKPAVIDFGAGKEPDYQIAGVEPAKKFLDSLGTDNDTRETVLKLVRFHLAPTLLYVAEKVHGAPVSDGTIRVLAEQIAPATIFELALLNEADEKARVNGQKPEAPDETLLSADAAPGAWLLERARALGVDLRRPGNLMEGREFIALGFKPGKELGALIRLANQLRDEHNFTHDGVITAIKETKNPQEAIAKLEMLRRG